MAKKRSSRNVAKNHKIMDQKLNSKGYLEVVLENNLGEKQVHQVHDLVMSTFVGPCPEGMEVRHINGIKTDNRLENLQYCFINGDKAN